MKTTLELLELLKKQFNRIHNTSLIINNKINNIGLCLVIKMLYNNKTIIKQ